MISRRLITALILSAVFFCADHTVASVIDADSDLIQIKEDITSLKKDIKFVQSKLKDLKKLYGEWLKQDFNTAGVEAVMRCQSERGFIYDQGSSGWGAYRESIFKNHHIDELDNLCGEESFGGFWRKMLTNSILMNTEHITIFDKGSYLETYFEFLKLELLQLNRLYDMSQKVRGVFNLLEAHRSYKVKTIKEKIRVGISNSYDILNANFHEYYYNYQGHSLGFVRFRNVIQIEQRIHQQSGTDQEYVNLNNIEFDENTVSINSKLLKNKKIKQLEKILSEVQIDSEFQNEINTNKREDITNIEGFNEDARILLEALEANLNNLKDARDHRYNIHNMITKALRKIRGLEGDIKSDWRKYNKKVKKAVKKSYSLPDRSVYVRMEDENRKKITEQKKIIEINQAILKSEVYDSSKMIYLYSR